MIPANNDEIPPHFAKTAPGQGRPPPLLEL
ncbi:MAG: hypothetical protein UZ03_NOB001002753 [Nitrospira sp. OLB3]|nr:MAG: hypothetical protein UZ03_NOB001002753 [Nitrospira sp. OLB3]